MINYDFIQDIPKINLKINLITLGFILRYSGHTYSGPRLHRRNRHQKKLTLIRHAVSHLLTL
ncbi:TPA: hypothetical protein ACHKS4_004524, partial [Escherichia coli]